jgi:hypothetical protein
MNIYFLCLSAFVAILSGLSGLGNRQGNSQDLCENDENDGTI